MLLEIIVPTAIFTAIVVILSALVLLARRRLEPSGPVSIDVNGEQTVSTEAGRRLLWALAENGIYLPAACGGRGTCGQCRVTVRSGGGPSLPTEALHIDAEALSKGARLACAVRIREDMQISLPTSILDVRQWSCEVISTRSVSTFIKELVLKLPEPDLMRFDAGAYVIVEAPPHEVRFQDLDIGETYQEDWHQSGLPELGSVTTTSTLRAYSLANPPQVDDRLVLLVRIATPPATAPPGTPPGQASSYLFSLSPGDRIAVSGPFGEFRARESGGEMIFIAGGVGIAPIRSIILDQLARGSSRKMSLWYGARARKDLCYIEDFEEAERQHENFELHVALSAPREDDKRSYHRGFVHMLVRDHYLSTHSAPGDVEYYLCGPPLMSTAVIAMLEQLGVDHSQILFDDFGG
ncbi:MAG: NADH:ubiquinone reductase (Na(+)-transporting) subunit F [Gammaproteobacteria bacterium]